LAINRIRQIKPDYFEDEKVAMVSIGARLFFIGLWVHMDRNGIIDYNSMLLRNTIFPFDKDITVEDVDSFINELCDTGFNNTTRAQPKSASARPLLIRAKFDGVHYLYATSFRKHQSNHHREQPKYMLPIDILKFTVEKMSSGVKKPCSSPGLSGANPVHNGLWVMENGEWVMGYELQAFENVDNSVNNVENSDTPIIPKHEIKKSLDKLLGREQ